MKEFAKLTASAYAYYSGNEYHEEVFLPKEVWEEIKPYFDTTIHIGELDGKHSVVKGEIEVEIVNEQELVTYKPFESDGEKLFEHIYEYLDGDKYDNKYLLQVQEKVESLCVVEELTITINKNQKEEILALLSNYII